MQFVWQKYEISFAYRINLPQIGIRARFWLSSTRISFIRFSKLKLCNFVVSSKRKNELSSFYWLSIFIWYLHVFQRFKKETSAFLGSMMQNYYIIWLGCNVKVDDGYSYVKFIFDVYIYVKYKKKKASSLKTSDEILWEFV